MLSVGVCYHHHISHTHMHIIQTPQVLTHLPACQAGVTQILKCLTTYSRLQNMSRCGVLQGGAKYWNHSVTQDRVNFFFGAVD